MARIPLLAQEVAKASIARKWKGIARADRLPLSACNLSSSLAGVELPQLTRDPPQPALLLSAAAFTDALRKGWHPCRAVGVLGTWAPCPVPAVCSPASPCPPSSLSQANPLKPGLETLFIAQDCPEMLLLHG